MENASKALLIAGGILLAILVLSIGIIIVRSYRDTAESYYTEMSKIEIDKINTYYTKLHRRGDIPETSILEGDISAQEIVSVINYAKENYKNFGTDVEIIVSGVSPVLRTDYSNSESIKPGNTELIEFIQNNLYKKVSGNIQLDENNNPIRQTFKCEVDLDNITEEGLIKKVTFTKI